MRLLERPWLFDLGAEVYGWFNTNETWHESCARLASFLPPRRADAPLRVLDLGCGPGVTAITLARVRPDLRLVGADIAPRMLGVARRATARARLTGSISYVLADAAALPFPAGSLDATTGHSFLYLVRDRARVLQEAYRVLRPGGRYISMEPRDGQVAPGVMRRHWRDLRFLVSIGLWRPYSKYHGRFDEKRFPAALERAGFKNTGTQVVLEGLGIIGYGEK